MRSPSPHCPQQGSTVLENILVIGLIALLLLGMLPPLGHFLATIRDTQIRLAGETFQQNLSILHIRWELHPQEYIGQLHFNENGWPDGSEYAPAAQGLATCRGLWQGIMTETRRSAGSDAGLDATTVLRLSSGTDDGVMDGVVVEHPASRVCVYRYQGVDSDTHTRLLLYQVGSNHLEIIIH